MKRKFIYTLFFILCLGGYASSKEYAATGKKEECKERAKTKQIEQMAAEGEIAELSSIAHFFLAI